MSDANDSCNPRRIEGREDLRAADPLLPPGSDRLYALWIQKLV